MARKQATVEKEKNQKQRWWWEEMRIAIEGCSHGALDRIYASIQALDAQAGKATKLLILCGDVQTLRNRADLDCLAVPAKYKQLGDFHRYYNGRRRAPILTIMIGGNHEASNYLWELYHGGWVAPNMYYLGPAGCLEVGGLIIAGASGIYKSHDYLLGRFERLPYNPSTVRSVYHTRQYDIFRLKLLAEKEGKPDVVLSHDWPNTIEQHGDSGWLVRKKPFFKDEINTSTLGSPPLLELLKTLKPKFWFSAHLHVRFAALFKHSGEDTQVRKPQSTPQSAVQHRVNEEANDEEIKLEDDLEMEENIVGEQDASNHFSTRNDEEMNIGSNVEPTVNGEEIVIENDDGLEEKREGETEIEDEDPKHGPNGDAEPISLEVRTAHDSTRFLALSKCLEGQDFLQILDIEAPFDSDDTYHVSLKGERQDLLGVESLKQPSLRLNRRWLAVTRATHEYLSLEKQQRTLPRIDATLEAKIKEEEMWIDQHLNLESGNAEDMQEDDDKHPLAVRRTQIFQKTAPPTTDPNGLVDRPPPWYTNPQTEALCSFLQVPMLINPPPSTMAPPAQLPKTSDHASAQPPHLRPPILSEEEEVRRIEEAAKSAMARKKVKSSAEPDARPVDDNGSGLTTLMSEDEEAMTNSARWKEGTG